MLAEEQKLRWWGIDMRSRRRRRVAVVATYLVIFVAGMYFSTWNSHPVWGMVCFGATSTFIELLGVMGKSGLVKKFEGRTSMSVRGVEMVWVEGLDEWAKYHYGVENFDAASAEQKDELLSRFKAGKRLFPARTGSTDAPWLDEREKKERDASERWSRNTVLTLLAGYAGIYTTRAYRHEETKPLGVACEFFMFAVLLSTLPRARVLWTEPDPRELSGELEMLKEQEV